MIYFLSGENSYRALRKIREFKAAFSKKADKFLVEEFDGEISAPIPVEFRSILSQINLFSKIRLVIFKNILGTNAELLEILQKSGDFLKKSRDVFVFWEKDLKKHKEVLSFFKKFAEKTQEVKILGPKELDLWLSKKAQTLDIKISKEERDLMIEEAGEEGEWALENELEKKFLEDGARADKKITHPPRPLPYSKGGGKGEGVSPFLFIEKMFGTRALLALKEMALAGIEPSRFIYAFLWKLKQKKMADAYLNGILAESKMRRDPKNSQEILERFIFSLKV